MSDKKVYSIRDIVEHNSEDGYGSALIVVDTDEIIDPYVDPSDWPDLEFTNAYGGRDTTGKYFIEIHSGQLEHEYSKQRKAKKNPMKKGCSQKTRSSNIADMVAGRKGHRKRSVKQASAIAYKFAREQGCPLPTNYLKQNPAIADHFERLYHLGKAIAFDLVEKIVEPTMEETRNFYYKSIGTLIGSGDIYSELEQEMVLEGFLHALSKDHKD